MGLIWVRTVCEGNQQTTLACEELMPDLLSEIGSRLPGVEGQTVFATLRDMESRKYVNAARYEVTSI